MLKVLFLFFFVFLFLVEGRDRFSFCLFCFRFCGVSCLDGACMVLFWLMVFRAVQEIQPRVLILQYRYAQSLVLAFFVFLFLVEGRDLFSFCLFCFTFCGCSCLDWACMVLFWWMVFRAV